MLRMLVAGLAAASFATSALAQEAEDALSATAVLGDQPAQSNAYAYPVTNKSDGSTTFLMRFKSNAARREQAREQRAANEIFAEAGAARDDAVSFPARRYAADGARQTAAFR